MKLIYSIVICVLVASCSATSHLRSVKYKFKSDSTIVAKGKVLEKWINLYKIEVHNKDWDIEYHYIYADSSILYISNAETFCFPNSNNIKNIHSEESKLRLQDHRFIKESNKQYIKEGHLSLVMPQAPYNMVFFGKDEHGLYWKDIKYGNISIGYIGVSKENKLLFDNALNLFRVGAK